MIVFTVLRGYSEMSRLQAETFLVETDEMNLFRESTWFQNWRWELYFPKNGGKNKVSFEWSCTWLTSNLHRLLFQWRFLVIRFLHAWWVISHIGLDLQPNKWLFWVFFTNQPSMGVIDFLPSFYFRLFSATFHSTHFMSKRLQIHVLSEMADQILWTSLGNFKATWSAELSSISFSLLFRIDFDIISFVV